MDTIITVITLLTSLIFSTGPTSNSGSVSSLSNIFNSFNTTVLQASQLQASRMSYTPDQTNAVVLAIDVSDSMYGVPLERAQEMSRYFINNIDPDVEVALVTFANSAEVITNYTTDRHALEKALQSLYTQGVTALYDGSYMAVQLAAQSTATNRTVILLSDGGEYGSQSTSKRDDALKLAQKSGVELITVGLGHWTDADYLNDLAFGTNGSAFEAPSVNDIDWIYRQLTSEFSNSEALADTAVLQNKIAPLSTPAPTDTSVMTNSGSQRMFVDGPAPENTNGNESGNLDDAHLAITDARSGSTAIVLAIDVSDSMYGYPLERARQVTDDFVKTIDTNVPVAIVTFANKAELVQDFTTNRTQLDSVLTHLQTKGVTALYDGGALAVNVAMSSNAANPIVILLSDGGEYGGQSKSLREEALTLAHKGNVEIITVGFGHWVDADYLSELAKGTKSEFYTAPTLDDLNLVYDQLSTQFTNVNASTIPTLDNQPTVETLDVFGNNITGADDLSNITDEIATLGLDNATTHNNGVEVASGTVEPLASTDLLDSTSPSEIPNPSSDEMLDTQIAELTSEMGISNNVMPVHIDVSDGTEVAKANLLLNGILLKTFTTKPPYEYDLDLNMLDAGQYKLSMEMESTNGDVRIVNNDFEVKVIDQLPLLGGTGNETDISPDSELGSSDTNPVVSGEAPRLVLVDGQAQNLNFTYSDTEGLVPVHALTTTPVEEEQTLGSILTSPLSLIPEPLQIALATPNPELVALIILIMTVVLLPQGLFTLYWMMYTWNHPDKLEESRSPKEYVEPQFSFTAILPARKEEDVIKQTIYAVDRIEYPDHLKEILIMIRDEDDDATIEQARQAIQEIGKDHIRLITFKDGPKNKPNGLNRGLHASTKDVVCIFDAEDEPHPEIYNVVNTVMVQKEADVVQSGVQLMNFDSNWFSAFNCLEYFFWFKSGLHAFTHKFNVTPLGGNTVFFKRPWLERINGWDEACLTEDADVGIRLTQIGAKIEIVYDERHATQEETPDTAESFIKQRTRWVQGFYQIFFKGDWMKLPQLKQKIVAVYILLNSLMQAGTLIFLPVGIYIAATQRISVPLALLSYIPIYILLIQMVMNLIGIREFTEAYGKRLPWFFTMKMIIYYYPFQLMMAISALRAVYRFFAGNSAWEKTAHSNLHRLAMES